MNRFRRILGLAFAAFAFPLMAQIPSGYVQTTATVSTLANGTYAAAWTNLSSSPQLALLGCASTFQQTVNGTFDSNGHFSVLLADTSQICPSPSTWTFTFTFYCPSAPPSGAFQVQVAVTGGGGTEDISSQITAALPANPCGGGSGGTVLYPSPTVNAIPRVSATGSSTKLANSALSDDGTTVASTEPVTGPSATFSNLQGVAQCPSSSYADIGQCINADSTAASINVLDGTYSTSTVIAPVSGQKIHWGVGVYTVAGVNCPDSTATTVYGCNFTGVSQTLTTLKLAAGANRDLITDPNYSTLVTDGGTSYCGFGGNYALPACYGSFQLTVRNMTLDGNKANQTGASNVLRWYGRAALIENVTVQNGYTDCLDSTWLGDSNFSAPAYQLETHITNVTEQFCGANDATLWGPHDLYLTDNIAYQAGAYSYEIKTPVHAQNINAYLGTTGACYLHGQSGSSGSAASLDGSGVTCSIGSATGFALFVNNDAQVVNLTASTLASDGTTPTVTLLTAGNIINGSLVQLNSSGTGLTLGNVSYGGTVSFSGVLQSLGAWFNFVNENGGKSNIVATSNNTSGTALFTTNPSQADSIQLAYTPLAYGSSGAPFVQLPGSSFMAGGYSLSFPSANGTLFAQGAANPITLSTITGSRSGHTFGGYSFSFPTLAGTLAVTPGGTTTMQAWGIATLASGTVTVNNASACLYSSTCMYVFTRVDANGSTAIGNLTLSSATAGTSFTVTSLGATGATATGDNSVIEWRIN